MSKNESNPSQCGFRTSIGGQALIEGIMMRGPFKQAIVCRTEDGLVEKVEDLKWIKDRYPVLGWPFVRGIIVFLDSMIKGVKALTFSAELIPEDEEYEPVADESGSYLQPREDALQIFRIENRRDETPVRINNREILNRMVPVQTAENRPMSDGNTLSWFLDRVISLSPTEHMMVELWDHGAGPVRGVEHDEATDRYMRISDLRQALEKACEARQAAGLSGRLDMIGFDCCLMGNAEILVELQETAEYMVASELSEWGNGWDYSWLSVFKLHRGCSGSGVFP